MNRLYLDFKLLELFIMAFFGNIFACLWFWPLANEIRKISMPIKQLELQRIGLGG